MSSKPSLVLHIGTEKTGTTAIQEFLRLNAKRYTDKGVIIPGYLGWSNHSLFTCCFYSSQRKDEISLMHGMNDIEARSRIRDETLTRLKDQVSGSTSAKFIISSEHLHSRLTDELEIESLFEFASPLFNSVEVLLYIRKPIDTAVSSWSTSVKSGSCSTSLPNPSNPYIHNLCMHKESIMRWSKYFGESNVHVRLFRKDVFFRNDLICDFAASCGIDFPDNMILPPKVNEKLGFDGILFLSEINKQVPAVLDDRINPARRNLCSYFEQHFSRSPSYIPSINEVVEYSEYYRHSDQWVKRKYFNHLDSLWDDVNHSLLQPHINEVNAEVDRDLDIIQRRYSHEEVSRLLSLFAQVWIDKHNRIISLESQTSQKSEEIEMLKDNIKTIANQLRDIKSQDFN